MFFGLRFDFRNPEFAGTTMADRYAAALDMAEWADRLGCTSIAISEHHASPDGYIASPLQMLAAMAGRTTNVRLNVAALIAPLCEPLRLAEDLVVLDHLSRGRLDVILGAGYVRKEFEMFGVPTSERAKRTEDVLETLRSAFTGEPFEYRGRTVQVTPAPFRPGGPSILLGGSSEPAARRAARLADGFIPSVPEVWDFYRDELAKMGRPDPGPYPMGETLTIALATNPESAWEEIGPYFLHETNSYGAWLAENDGAGPYSIARDADDLRSQGRYRILTPDDYVRELEEMSFPFALLHPLCGGIPPELGWRTLRLFEDAVLPAFR